MNEPLFDFETRAAQIELRKRLLADAIRQANEGYKPQQGQMVSGHFVAPSWAQSLNAAIEPIANQHRVDQQQAALLNEIRAQSQDANQARQQWASNIPLGIPAQQGPIDPNNPTELQAQPPDRREVVAHALKALEIPGMSPVGSSMLQDTLIDAPKRAEDKTFRREENKADRATKIEALQETLEARKQELLARLEDRNLDRIARAEANSELRQVQLQIAQIAHDDRMAAIDAKSAGAKNSPSQQKREDSQDTLNLIGDAEKLIGSSTGSYVGAGVDQALRFFGKSTEGAENAAKLKALSANLVLKMPKLSGPQSDRDVQLYKEAAGQIGDATVPAATKKAALDTIKGIHQRYLGIGPTVVRTGVQNGRKVEQLSDGTVRYAD